MTLNEYQILASKYQTPTAPPMERVFGLVEEAGELIGKYKRMFRGDYSEAEAMEHIKKELGDVLWYLSRVAADNNWELEDIAQTNIDKLESRFIRKQLLGSGDNR